MLFRVEILAGETCDGRGEGEFAEAETEGESVFCKHFDGVLIVLVYYLVLRMNIGEVLRDRALRNWHAL